MTDRRIGTVLVGPGLGRGAPAREALAAVLDACLPAVLDADALHLLDWDALEGVAGNRVLLTPHEGEILRIAPDASDAELTAACKKYGCAIALKSSITRISEGERIARSTRGSPVLSRAGSGDIFAGICGA